MLKSLLLLPVLIKCCSSAILPSLSQRFIQYLASRTSLFNLSNFIDKTGSHGKKKHSFWQWKWETQWDGSQRAIWLIGGSGMTWNDTCNCRHALLHVRTRLCRKAGNLKPLLSSCANFVLIRFSRTESTTCNPAKDFIHAKSAWFQLRGLDCIKRQQALRLRLWLKIPTFFS